MCLKVAAGDYLSSLCLFRCVWLGWLAGTILPRLLRASYLCAKAHTCHFPAQLTYTKARPHSLRAATRPKRLTGIQGLLWRMHATTAVADTPTDQPTNGLHDRDTTQPGDLHAEHAQEAYYPRLIQASHSGHKTAAGRQPQSTCSTRPVRHTTRLEETLQRPLGTLSRTQRKTTKEHAHEKHHPRQAQAGRTETSSRDSTRHRNPKLFRGPKAAAIEIEEKETERGRGCEQCRIW
jgi:hypothetical protein